MKINKKAISSIFVSTMVIVLSAIILHFIKIDSSGHKIQDVATTIPKNEQIPKKSTTKLAQPSQSSSNKNAVNIKVEDNGKVGAIFTGDSNVVNLGQHF